MNTPVDHPARSRSRSRWIVRISNAALLASTFTFAGCLARPPLNKATFAFDTPASSVTNATTSDRVLAIRSLEVAPPFDGRALVYRTGEFLFQRDPYAEFLDSPEEGLLGPVSGMLRGAGCFGAVVEPGSAVKPDTLVEINITQLYGDFRTPGSPYAVLAMELIFLNATNGIPGKVIFQRAYSRRVPMNSPSPGALMAGWNNAFMSILADVTSALGRAQVDAASP